MKMTDYIYCSRCNKKLCKAIFPWDAGDDTEYLCLDCNPLTKHEKELIKRANIRKLQRLRNKLTENNSE